MKEWTEKGINPQCARVEFEVEIQIKFQITNPSMASPPWLQEFGPDSARKERLELVHGVTAMATRVRTGFREKGTLGAGPWRHRHGYEGFNGEDCLLPDFDLDLIGISGLLFLMKTKASPRVEIHFCPGCRWWLRAGWLAQEIFATFGDRIGEVALVTADSGHFSIRCGDNLLWEREADGGFPEPKELKQRIRNHLFPDLGLGHNESNSAAT